MDKFKEDFFKLIKKLKAGENFAFTRFSDGEIAVMQGKKLVLASDHVILGDNHYGFGYSQADHKEFVPERDKHLTEELLSAYKHKQENYYVGGLCDNCDCASSEFKEWMQEEYGQKDEHHTFANLWVNSNYPLFANHFLKALSGREVVIIVNENANTESFEANVVKTFRVGKNCIVNDWHLIEEIKKWIKEEEVKNTVFLFSASSLSEVLIYNLFKELPENTYIDIGTTLHKQLGMELDRDYLKAYWGGMFHPDMSRSCK